MKWIWPWQRKTLTSADLALDLLREAASKTGIRVTWETALQASTSCACDRVIADGLAQVPLKLYRSRQGGGADPATDHPLYNVLHSAVNEYLTSFEWRETAGLHLAGLGRSYSYINRVDSVRASRIELFPLTPQQVRTEQAEDRRTRYFVQLQAGNEQEVAAEKILHLRGPSWNGWEGLDGIRLAREAIGLALATEEHGARLFKNGAITGGILSTEKNLDLEQRKALRESWESMQNSIANVYRTAVLWGGMKYQPRAMQNDQAQWVEVRRFQVQEVCRFKRVLPIMVGEADRTATYASSEQMFLAHAVHTMGPWYKRVEQRLDLQLLTPQEREAGYFCRFNMAGLLRGAHRDRAEFYRILYGIRAINPNEIRDMEEWNPYIGGDEYLPIGQQAPAPQGNPA